MAKARKPSTTYRHPTHLPVFARFCFLRPNTKQAMVSSRGSQNYRQAPTTLPLCFLVSLTLTTAEVYLPSLFSIIVLSHQL